MLYTFYSFLNFFFAPIAGYIALKIGLGAASVLFSTLVFAGVFVCFLGVHFQKWLYIQIGWGLVACGAESMINTQVASIAKWFSGKRSSFAFGLKFGYSQATGCISDYICPVLYQKYRSLLAPFFVVNIMAFMSVVMAAVYCYIDHYKARKYLTVNEPKNKNKNKKTTNFSISDLKNMGLMFWLILGA
jgi:MFS family permease